MHDPGIGKIRIVNLQKVFARSHDRGRANDCRGAGRGDKPRILRVCHEGQITLPGLLNARKVSDNSLRVALKHSTDQLRHIFEPRFHAVAPVFLFLFVLVFGIENSSNLIGNIKSIR